MSDRSMSLTLCDAEATTAFATALSRHLKPGDVILLSGPVGAGKTHFARALILSLLDTPEDIPSPTFTLVQTYGTRIGELWHSDLYRISSTAEIEELGLTDAFDTAVCLIEWPDRLGTLRPDDVLEISLDQGVQEDARRAVVRWNNPRWDATVAQVTAAMP